MQCTRAGVRQNLAVNAVSKRDSHCRQCCCAVARRSSAPSLPVRSEGRLVASQLCAGSEGSCADSGPSPAREKAAGSFQRRAAARTHTLVSAVHQAAAGRAWSVAAACHSCSCMSGVAGSDSHSGDLPAAMGGRRSAWSPAPAWACWLCQVQPHTRSACSTPIV